MSDGEEGPATKKFKISNEKRLIVILEEAQLETAKVGKNYELLSSDKHATFLKRQHKNPGDYRPDITHQCLLMLLDSPLNRAGLLQIYIHTVKNVLIEVSPQTRIPRTFDRFAGLMVELLHKLTIRAADGSQKLLKVIKNPIAAHLPVGCAKIGTSFQAEELTQIKDVVPKKEPVAIVVGAMAKGKVHGKARCTVHVGLRIRVTPDTEPCHFVRVRQTRQVDLDKFSLVANYYRRNKVNADYTESEIKISSYPLSAALTCAKLCHVFEETWDIL